VAGGREWPLVGGLLLELGAALLGHRLAESAVLIVHAVLSSPGACRAAGGIRGAKQRRRCRWRGGGGRVAALVAGVFRPGRRVFNDGLAERAGRCCARRWDYSGARRSSFSPMIRGSRS
jgi:hypothetical protein